MSALSWLRSSAALGKSRGQEFHPSKTHTGRKPSADSYHKHAVQSQDKLCSFPQLKSCFLPTFHEAVTETCDPSWRIKRRELSSYKTLLFFNSRSSTARHQTALTQVWLMLGNVEQRAGKVSPEQSQSNFSHSFLHSHSCVTGSIHQYSSEMTLRFQGSLFRLTDAVWAQIPSHNFFTAQEALLKHRWNPKMCSWLPEQMEGF